MFAANAPRDVEIEGEWSDPETLGELALPSVMKKVITLGLRN